MNTDDIIYLCLLLFSIAFGYIFRWFSSSVYRQFIGSIIGILIVLVVSGYHILHQILVTSFTILLLRFCHPRYCHVISFAVLFPYLFFFRLYNYVGLPSPPGHTNAIQMILTLKLIGLCFEVHDTWQKQCQLKRAENGDRKQLELVLKYEAVSPSSIDIFHYAFSYIGILTGPYYKYRVFEDTVIRNNQLKSAGLDCLAATKKRFSVLPIYIGLFLVSSSIFPLSFARSEEIFRDYSFLYRVWYMTPTFFIFRMRIYSGFVLSECSCIMAGLGAYPSVAKAKPGQGPTDYAALEERKEEEGSIYDFETIHNINEWDSDFSPTVRGGIRAWNMTVQFWLVSNVYKRLRLAKPLKEAVTMLTSAFWHGVYPGYYLSLLTVPFIIAVEDFYQRKIRRRLSEQGQKVYDFFSWILKMQQFGYMSMAFLLLDIDTTLHYWRSIGFIFHGIIAMQHGFAQFINLIMSKVDQKLQKSSQTTLCGDVTYRVMKTIDPDDEIINETESKKKK